MSYLTPTACLPRYPRAACLYSFTYYLMPRSLATYLHFYQYPPFCQAVLTHLGVIITPISQCYFDDVGTSAPYHY